MDCDNTFSDNPVEWKFPEDVANAFPNVMFAVCYSRNHMKEKNGTMIDTFKIKENVPFKK